LLRLVQVTDTLGRVTKSSYDEVGKRISQVDANNDVTNFQYDSMGRIVGRSLPAGMSESFTYDMARNRATYTDFPGKTATLAYDAMSRLLRRTPDPNLGEASVQLSYTLTERRASMVDSVGTTNYTYDNRDRLLAKAGPQSRRLAPPLSFRGWRCLRTSNRHSTARWTLIA
jgi:YD repeat-containing protein